jgi:hypothetical protein
MPFKDPAVWRAHHTAYMRRRYSSDLEFRRKHKNPARRNDIAAVERIKKRFSNGENKRAHFAMRPLSVAYLLTTLIHR